MAKSNRSYFYLFRLSKAIWRQIMLLYFLYSFRPDSILIFTSNGWSLKEKVLMGQISKWFGVRVSLFFRSGAIFDELHANKKLQLKINTFDNVLVQGKKWCDLYKEVFQTNVTSVMNWIEITENEARPMRRGKIRNITFMGWLNDNKGIMNLLECFNDLLLEGFDLKLHVAGDGPLKEALVRFVEMNSIGSNVELYGWVNNMEKQSILKNTDLFILPSRSEGMPNAILEALSHDLLCMGTKIDGLTEIIERSGGFFCERENLKNDIRNLLTGSWDFVAIGNKNRDYLRRYHSLSVIEELVSVL